MKIFRHMAFLLLNALCVQAVSADSRYEVQHLDTIQIDPQLSLPQLVEQTWRHYPEYALTQARLQEANAVRQRGDKWLAGPLSFSASYLDDWLADDTGYREFDAQLDIPLWRWGQRESGQQLAIQAEQAVDLQTAALKLRVCGLVRNALWALQLADSRWQQAQQAQAISKKLLHKVEQRVELGDLPRSDLLLAQSDFLQKRSLLTQAEAEVMHSRQNFISLSGDTRVPVDIVEKQTEISEITAQHPLIQAVNAQVQRMQAEVDWIARQGSGQPRIQLGMKSERDARDGNDIESAGIGITIPFGGEDFVAPQVADKNIQLTQLVARRDLLFRELQRALHEAKHMLQIDQAELAVSNELKTIAVKHLEMSELSFSAGEINLMDLLKIQAQAEHAIRHAKEQEVKQQRDIAFYNQAVGVLP